MADQFQRHGSTLRRLSFNLPVLAWCVHHSAWLHNRYQPKSGDGRTPHQRVFGKGYRKGMYEFGEQVLYKETPTPSSDLAARFYVGTWVGKHNKSDEHIVLTPSGRKLVRAGKTRPSTMRRDGR
eukprot:4143075-Amphidinium_carterae.4